MDLINRKDIIIYYIALDEYFNKYVSGMLIKDYNILDTFKITLSENITRIYLPFNVEISNFNTMINILST